MKKKALMFLGFFVISGCWVVSLDSGWQLASAILFGLCIVFIAVATTVDAA